MVMDDEQRQLRWCAHCLRMAEATHALADWCEDVEMMGAYVALAAKWINLSSAPPPRSSPPAPGDSRLRH
jgi:hypothetical protein